MAKRTLLIDGDILIYSICSAAEYVARFDEDTDVAFCNVHEALNTCIKVLTEWKDRMEAQDVVVAFSGSSNFRKIVYPAYKAHRKSCRKPCGYRPVKEMLGRSYTSVEQPTLEGDDILGILQTSGKYEASVVVSSDKDLNCIPGLLWNPDKDEQKPRSSCNRSHLAQHSTRATRTRGSNQCTDEDPGTPLEQ